MFLVRIFIKITGFIPALFGYLPRKFFVGKRFSTWRKRGPMIVVENHRGFMDFPVMLMMFPFRKVTVVVSELLWDHSRFLRFMLKAFGAIRADRFSGNPDFINKSVKVLKKGGILLMYPEGKIETTDEIYEFKQSVALISMQSGAPVLPIYHDGNIGYLRRDNCVIGDLMYPVDFTTEDRPLTDNIKGFTNAIRDNIVAYKGYFDSFIKTPADKPKERFPFGYRFVQITANPLIRFLLRPKLTFTSPAARAAHYTSRRLIIVTNHSWWLDPPTVYYLFKKRLLSTLSARDVAEKNRIVHTMERVMNCVFINRDGFDWLGIRECAERLKNEGVLLIFPEGHLNFGEELLAFQSGAAILSLMTDSPVLPIYIDGGYLPARRLRVRVGDPVSLTEIYRADGLSNQAVEQGTQLLFERLNALKSEVELSLSHKDRDRITAFRKKNRARLARNLEKELKK